MTSLSRRVSVAVVSITSAVVLVASAVLWLVTQSVLLNGTDRELVRRAERMRNIEPLAVPEGWRRPPPPQTEQRERRRGPSGDWRGFMQVFATADGRELHRSGSFPPEIDLVASDQRDQIHPTPWSRTLTDGSHVRIFAVRLTRVEKPPSVSPEGGTPRPADSGAAPLQPAVPQPTAPQPEPVVATSATPTTPAPGVTIFFAHDLQQTDDELQRMAVVLAVLWAAATVLALGAAWLLRPAILRPTRQLAEAIATLGPDDLAARVPAAAAPTEMQTVVERLNGLLDRLEQAFRREQATIANIAHELRTPVATLRTALEFRLLAATAETDRTGITELLTTVERMQIQVTNLLLLARLEAGKEPLPHSEVDLGDLAGEAVERWESRSNGRTLACSVAGDAPVLTSPDHLGLVLDNLIGNAIAHGSDGAIEIAVRIVAGRAILTVANPFTGTLDAAQLGQAYYRGDSARRADDHSGLGLALCQRLCRLLGATFTLATDGGRFTATVTLPLVAGTVEP